jgi:hypothetical protein
MKALLCAVLLLTLGILRRFEGRLYSRHKNSLLLAVLFTTLIFYFLPALTRAHRALCAAAIRLRPAADIFRRVAVARLTFVRLPPIPSSTRNAWFSFAISSFISVVIASILIPCPLGGTGKNNTRITLVFDSWSETGSLDHTS